MALAKRTGRSKSYYACQATIEQLDDLENIYLAEKQLEENRAGRAKTVSLEEVMRQHGLED